MVYPNPTSPWASAPLLVPKPPDTFRFTVDLRGVNKYTVKHQYPMPNLEQELTKVGRSKFYAEFDVNNCYWQFLVALLCQMLFSFITPDGIFTPTRVPHGTTNAVTYLQSSLASTIPPDLLRDLLLWLDDILLHKSSISGLLESLQKFFAYCVEYNLKLHPSKCILYVTEIRWCGRIISEQGIKFDPRRLSGLVQMEPPTHGAHLQQFLCAMQWLSLIHI